jgi:transcriptional regulator with XRE-family HTH domain
MNAIELQQQLFATIKSKVADHLSAPEEIAKLLDVSVDSVYRRMRGEKPITLDELHTLCSNYKISVDQLMNIQTGAFLFHGNILDSKNFRFDAYLTTTMHNMAYFKSFKQTDFYYLCKDMPMFHQFHSRELATFKYYFWLGTLIGFPDFKDKKVSFEEYPDSIFEMGKKVLELYYQMDTFEIWNLESLNATLRQIDYYIEAKKFHLAQDVIKIYDAIESFINHLEKQAELGYKFKYNDPEKKPMGKFYMYLNEWLLLDNSMMIIMDGTKQAVVPHSSVNYMMTRDSTFNENFYRHIQNLIKRSTLISQVSEKERSRFFRMIRDKIQARKHALKL